jgi:hypothetical protein
MEDSWILPLLVCVQALLSITSALLVLLEAEQEDRTPIPVRIDRTTQKLCILRTLKRRLDN